MIHQKTVSRQIQTRGKVQVQRRARMLRPLHRVAKAVEVAKVATVTVNRAGVVKAVGVVVAVAPILPPKMKPTEKVIQSVTPRQHQQHLYRMTMMTRLNHRPRTRQIQNQQRAMMTALVTVRQQLPNNPNRFNQQTHQLSSRLMRRMKENHRLLFPLMQKSRQMKTLSGKTPER
jgi:hypothetical protein